MFLGWKELYIDNSGMPVPYKTHWKASCFILLFWVVYIGKVVKA